jgi:hypothetical protein
MHPELHRLLNQKTEDATTQTNTLEETMFLKVSQNREIHAGTK